MTTKLGQKVRDIITGFEGVATGRCEYITGCNQILVAPRVKDDGTKPDPQWLDEDRLEVTDAKAITLPLTSAGFDVAAPRK